MENAQKKKSFLNKFLDFVEAGGNKLPHPVTLFFILCLIIIGVSWMATKAGASVHYTALNRKTLELKEYEVIVKSLISAEGLRFILNTMVTNFTGFAPLGTVLVALIGIGICEGTGLMAAVLRKVVTSTPKRLITAVIVLAGVMSNVASDAGYVVLVPLGALVFLSFGRHPLAGLAAAFAGVSGGFSANLLLSTTDPLLAGLTGEAAKLLIPDYFVNPACNYYFMFVSTILITILGTIITEKVVEPRLGEYKGDAVSNTADELTDVEKRGLRFAGISVLLYIALLLALTIPSNALLRENGNLKSFIYDGLVPCLMLFFFIPGLVYGIVTKSISSDKDVAHMMGKALGRMGGYLALIFVSSQFVAYFKFTHLGTYIAVKGADGLKAIGFTGLPLILCFIVGAAFINLFMGSASAKWAILAPIFVPMLMQLGYSPEFTQMAYRIGDSSTNIITPLMSYFAMAIAFAEEYDENCKLGTLISIMLPYSVAFLIGWSLLLVVWYSFNLPIGPDAFIHMLG